MGAVCFAIVTAAHFSRLEFYEIFCAKHSQSIGGIPFVVTSIDIRRINRSRDNGRAFGAANKFPVFICVPPAPVENSAKSMRSPVMNHRTGGEPEVLITPAKLLGWCVEEFVRISTECNCCGAIVESKCFAWNKLIIVWNALLVENVAYV